MHLKRKLGTRALRHGQHGLSIVELMVGIAIGLFVLAGATLVTSTQLSNNRILLLETQIQQDLRATADLVTRELRRSGYWALATTTAWPDAGAPVNMYQTFDANTPGAGGRKEIVFSYSNALTTAAENSNVDADEQFGFALNATDGTIEAMLGGAGWQTLTDPNVVKVVQFDHPVTEQVLVVPCAKYCGTPAVAGDTTCWPRQRVRDVMVQITGKAVHDPSVVRSVRSGVRLRNDQITGTCPT
jgi:type IV pilus assembly protein PilW